MDRINFNHQPEIAAQENLLPQALNAVTTSQSDQSRARNVGAARLTDEKLLQLCQRYGEQARRWRQKFAGLLPEINKRRLYEKKGFRSIFEFAAKLAGMSEEQVRLVLNLEKRFEDKPLLQSMLENGDVSVNKLVKIASIATSENQEILANQVRILSTRALETLVRGERFVQKENVNFESRNGSQGSLLGGESLHVNSKAQDISLDVKSVMDETLAAHPLELLKLKLNVENLQKLLELQEKGIDLNNLIAGMLDRREEKIAWEKEEIAEGIARLDEDGKNKVQKINDLQKSKQILINAEGSNHHKNRPSRYIKVEIRKLIREEQGTKCSIAGCRKPASELHHAQRFSLSQTHDPRFLSQMCVEHHEIAHSIDVKFQQVRRAALRSG